MNNITTTIDEATVTELKQCFTAYWEYFAIRTACKMGIFDCLYLEALTEYQLELELEATSNVILERKNGLNLLLEALAQHQFIQKDEEDRYFLLPKGQLLAQSHPQSLKNACILWGEEHLTAWQNLEHSIRTRKPAFEKIYQQPFFDYLSEHSWQRLNYHKAMYEYARDDYAKLSNIHDFSTHQCIMDVGGSLGALLEALHQGGVKSKLYLFDRPEVLELLAPKKHCFQAIGGDFFKSIPALADAIVLSRVLHDWNDWYATSILHNVFQALPSGGTLYVLENRVDKIQDGAALLSLNMLLICNSFERTMDAYENLLVQVGFELQDAKAINSLQTLIIAKKP